MFRLQTKMNNVKTLAAGMICLLSGIFLLSCKKEYEKAPYNTIERFSIKDTVSGNEYRAVIKNDTLMIYWSQFTELPDSVAPEIIVSENAAVTPASGVKVALAEGVKYTVVAQNGQSRTYTLQPLNNQPPPSMTLDAAITTIGGSLTINGEYFIPDTTVTKLYLINTAKQQVQIPGERFRRYTSAQIRLTIPDDGSVVAGTYDVKLVTGKRTVINGPLEIQ